LILGVTASKNYAIPITSEYHSHLTLNFYYVCTAVEESAAPQTALRQSIRLLALQLQREETLEAEKKRPPKTPQQRRQTDSTETRPLGSASKPMRKGEENQVASTTGSESGGEAVVLLTPSDISLHRHFLDSRHLDVDAASADSDGPPPVKTPLKSELPGHEAAEETTLRRSPRLLARHVGNQMAETSATKSVVSLCSILSAACLCLLIGYLSYGTVCT